MSDEPSKAPHPPAVGLLWVGAAVVMVITAVAVVSYGASDEADAAPGSPLYGHAVQEAIQGLSGNRAKQPGANQAPLPAGVSADDVYWCEKCKTYHKRQPAGAAPVNAAGTPPLAPAIPQAAAGTDPAARPPIPAGLSPSEVYWCENCKAYHKRETAPAGGAESPAPPPAAPAPAAPTPVAPTPAAPTPAAPTPVAPTPVAPIPAAPIPAAPIPAAPIPAAPIPAAPAPAAPAPAAPTPVAPTPAAPAPAAPAE